VTSTTKVERLAIGPQRLPGELTLPPAPLGVVVFAHGSGSSRLSPRNQHVAQALQARALATLLFDLLTDDEAADRRNVFDIALLASRLGAAIDALRGRPAAAVLPVGLFGASTGAAAVVSRGGRPDLAGDALPRVRAPTLLIVGGADREVLELNDDAARCLRCAHELAVVPGATHLFEEAGALERVAALAADWFAAHLAAPAARA
jgi:putative phosphoribosyl transferase